MKPRDLSVNLLKSMGVLLFYKRSNMPRPFVARSGLSLAVYLGRNRFAFKSRKPWKTRNL
ncbi:hypothetical protein HTT03_09010 [Sulfitobacter sp. S0837]|nr:hypothetical protein [Sulfitobacter maritimus]